ncbi:hypothetical protein chiPu_0002157 [Chiloscyllium punctatum]|uniref:Uncharacterized protein n=1 Tax=Chiloscyllium punctatum TaxID=137246 RepID=A0A401S050_CHIPU|nr:hypothetical protein [Chiloscyllium punctatum]
MLALGHLPKETGSETETGASGWGEKWRHSYQGAQSIKAGFRSETTPDLLLIQSVSRQVVVPPQRGDPVGFL